MNFSKLKIVFINLHINCLLGFRKITFTIHLIFTSLAGITFRPRFTTFCSCYLFCHYLSQKNQIFRVKHMVCFIPFLKVFHMFHMFYHLMIVEFLSQSLFTCNAIHDVLFLFIQDLCLLAQCKQTYK